MLPLEFPGILMISVPWKMRLQEGFFFIYFFADAMDCQVELERAGMLIPETGWEPSLPASPAYSRTAQSLEFLKWLILICQ